MDEASSQQEGAPGGCMSTVAVVMGRAGSKGVPGKNTASVAGRLCIEWTIEAAQRAHSVDHVLVSSDCPKALELAQQLGAEPAPRRSEDATDSARVDVALAHTISDWAAAICDCEQIVMLYANVPVRPAGLIDRAIELLTRSGCDSVQSYARVGKYHPWWQAKLDADGVVSPWQGEVLNHGVYRRQDLPPSFVPDGGVVAMTRRTLMAPSNDGPHGFLGRDHRGIETAEGQVVDIDTPMDLLVADAILKELHAS